METFINFSQNQWLLLKQKLTPFKNPKNAKQCQKAITIITNEIQLINKRCKANAFASTKEEMLFFKAIKPKFCAQLIYFQILHKLLLRYPLNPKKRKQQLNKKIASFTRQNQKWIEYYYSDNTNHDESYFLRKNNTNINPHFSTQADYKIAQISAFKKLTKHFKNQNKKREKTASKTNITWTGSKVALVELIYAIHATTICNEGKASLKEMTTHFEQSFNINLGQYARSYLEIRNRKTIEKTQFLDQLKKELIKKMAANDEN